MTAQLNPRGDVAVLVPAAGAGVRLGPGAPKALRLLAGEPLLVHAVRRIAAAPSRAHASWWPPRPPSVEAVRRAARPGGAGDRWWPAAPSGRRRWPPRWPPCPAGPTIVLVHDAARALDPARAGRGGRGGGPRRARRGDPGAAGGRHDQGGRRRRAWCSAPSTGPRCGPCRPRRASAATVLTAAHAAAGDPLTDDAGLVEKQGVPVVCVPGSEYALKITRPFDLAAGRAPAGRRRLTRTLGS